MNNFRRGSRKHPSQKRMNRSGKRKRPTNTDKLVILRSVGRFAPDRLQTTLRYTDTTTSRGTTSNNAMNYNLRSSAFDPDSSLGSGAISGFTELANLYLSYRVLSMKITSHMVNEEVTGVTFVLWPSNNAANVNSLAASDLLEFSSNVRARSQIVSSVNGPRVTLASKVRGVDLYGKQYITDSNYAAGTGGNPNRMFYYNIGAMTTLGSNFTTHMSILTVIDYEVEFFEVRQLES